MAKVIALDIGGKRTGVAETDPLQMIASPRETVNTDQLEQYVKDLISESPVETIVLGEPIGLDGGDSDNSARVREWQSKLKESYPSISVVLQDERFSSKLAQRALIAGGVKKSKRREKGSLDKISAAIILQDYLDQR